MVRRIKVVDLNGEQVGKVCCRVDQHRCWVEIIEVLFGTERAVVQLASQPSWPERLLVGRQLVLPYRE